MSERLILVKLSDPKKKTQVVRILAQLPNLTAGVINNQLRSLPWMLPEVSDHQTLDNIRLNLEKLGCVVDVKYVKSRSLNSLLNQKKISPDGKTRPARTMKDVSPGKKKFQADFSLSFNSQSTGTSHEPKPVLRPKSKDEIKHPKPGLRIKARKTKNKSLTFWLTGLLALVVLVWLSHNLRETGNKPLGKKTGPRKSVSTSDRGTSGQRPGPAAKKGLGHARYRRNVDRSQKAEQTFKKAMEENLPKQRIQLLHETVRNNPYHLEAWGHLERILRTQGKIKQAEKVRQTAYEKNDKVRKVLRSIARKFGQVRTPLSLSPSEFRFYISLKDATREDILDKGFFLYRHLEKKYGSKKLSATFYNSEAGQFQMAVPPDSHIPDIKVFSEYFWKSK
jgi:hypothetical protein